MLGFHPPLEADEIPYSWLVTYCQLSGLPSARGLLEQLHIAHYQLASQFPGYVPFISGQSHVSAHEVIHEHTILPVFQPFLHPKTYSSALANLETGRASSLHSRMSLVANRINSGTVLRACSASVENDAKTVGRACVACATSTACWVLGLPKAQRTAIGGGCAAQSLNFTEPNKPSTQ